MLILAIYFSQSVMANDKQLLAQGKSCAKLVDNRLTRLTCFDEAFDTQLPDIKLPVFDKAAAIARDIRPLFWHRVVKQEKDRGVDDSFISNIVLNSLVLGADSKLQGIQQDTENTEDIIISQSALGALPPRPILVFSCIDNITRLQLLLHQPIDEGMTPLALEVDGEAIASRWFSESNGYLIRAGRGLPGIQDVRSMFDKKSLVIRSKITELDGLSFELKDLKESIKPLRSACHW